MAIHRIAAMASGAAIGRLTGPRDQHAEGVLARRQRRSCHQDNDRRLGCRRSDLFSA